MVRTGQTGANAPKTSNSDSSSIDSFLSDCFIATAVYGDPLNENINALRKYRENTLRKNMLGRMFIATYEKLGPIAAYYIKQDEGRREWTKLHIVEPALEFINK